MNPTGCSRAEILVTAREENEILAAEHALAKRFLRSRFVPLEVWRWLAGADPDAARVPWPAPPEVARLLSSLGGTLSRERNAHAQVRTSSDLAWTAGLMHFIHQTVPERALASQHRMLACCVLPLYRGLAGAEAPEVLAAVRRQLADALALSALIREFQPELTELLAAAIAEDKTPYDLLDAALGVDLEQVAQCLLVAGHGWSGRDPDELNDLVSRPIALERRPNWAAREILWRLAGELLANHTQFVVPREWVQVPVPWDEASRHWCELAAALEQDQRPDRQTPPGMPAESLAISQPEQRSREVAVSSPGTNGELPAELPAEPPLEDMDEVTRLKLEIEIADSIDALVQSTRLATQMGGGSGDSQDGFHGGADDDFVVPRVIIAEIRSHNDPAFVAVVRRQLAICRSDERSVSLVAARVQPDEDSASSVSEVIPEDQASEAQPALQSLGLAAWQQKLVHWMAEHPEVNDPYAFVSGNGELILCLMDVERNTATMLLRQGLVKVLTGQTIVADTSASLARVQIPARFHSGIASVSAPAASFEPEQLIEATYRCLAAAQRHGKASIKSIEVF